MQLQYEKFMVLMLERFQGLMFKIHSATGAKSRFLQWEIRNLQRLEYPSNLCDGLQLANDNPNAHAPQPPFEPLEPSFRPTISFSQSTGSMKLKTARPAADGGCEPGPPG